ncbi:uncharacterized protein [Musca autumnalis]|uniref:uncharacterized protein n=1 Tax=Musca autumnalis TaxID=221902 RepID=UPI003CE8B1F0
MILNHLITLPGAIILFHHIGQLSGLATQYEFVFENDKVFDVCPDEENSKGVYDVFDISTLTFGFNDGSVSVSGDMQVVWEGVEPSDRVESRVELMKLVRGSWQPTAFSLYTKNFCEAMFNEKTLYYQVWSQHILESDRKCITSHHTIHHRPFVIDTKVNYAINMEGHHKLVVRYTAFDEMDVKRPKAICFEIHGEFFKV